MHAMVIGGGVAGLGTALTLSKLGHRVTVIERDDTPTPADPGAAFSWDRRGAPQVRHSHALLGRLHNLLRDEHPEVLSALLDAGATEIKMSERMPPTLDDQTVQPGDEDLVMIAARRTTFEWVLRTAVLANPDVEILTGRGVDGFLATGEGIPQVTGVRLEDGTTVDADIVVAANGRRSNVPDWLAGVGATLRDDEVEDTGIVYYSRFYELADGAEFPGGDRLIGGDLTYLKYGVFWGDNNTFSVTLATADDDRTFRAVRDDAVFDTIARTLPATTEWMDGRAAPITPVHSMAGLLNRRRWFVEDDRPVATGFFAVGDANICTNPLYGRGCSTAFWQAHLLGQAISNGGAAEDQAVAYHDAVRQHVVPWYKSSVQSDRSSRQAVERARAIAAGEDVEEPAEEQMKRSILREGLNPASRTDAVVWRAFMRMMNLLESPQSLTEPDVAGRIFAAWEDRHNRPPEPSLGPPRDELLEILGLTEAA